MHLYINRFCKIRVGAKLLYVRGDMRRIAFIMIIMLCLFGCSDTALSLIPDPPTPEITVSPLEYDFGNLAAGENFIKEFSISNIGTAKLSISDISLSNNNGIFLLDADVVFLEPNESADIYVVYNPTTYEENSNIVNIRSNDADESLVQILLSGRGSAPIIDISPWNYNFGTVNVGCEEEEILAISNVGNLDLIISNIIYTSNVPYDFYPESFYNINGDFPWTIAPGNNIAIPISYMPEDIQIDNGVMTVYSNDLIQPEATAEQMGYGSYGDFVTDTFEQEGASDVDILFVIDNSGSMLQNQTNFKDNFDSFINAFYNAGIGYQIGFITTDNKNLVSNSIITNLSPDPVTEVNDIIDLISTHGMGHEKGLLYSYLATQLGEWAGLGSSFLRPSARLVVIYLSDEPDQSSPTVSPIQVSNHLLALKGSLAMVTAHAVAGDFPSGCTGNGSAQFGDGYYDVVSDLNGTFLSICSSSWGLQMDSLARNSMLPNSFPLSNTPVVSSIEAYVDGAIDFSWTFEESTNSVVFSTPPAEGGQVDISYAIYYDCD